MFLAKIVFAVFTCTSLINYVFVTGQEKEENLEEPEDQQQEEEKATPLDNHTFVALIDILFTNGRKRSCTGTIIHDNVVITAAHCFVDNENSVLPELTASFVVIGTKKMFDTGYENYLPIERVITHPDYKGWTADIALVFTFAGMTSDKPGHVIPLVGERTLTPLDSNVTVLSWGHCKDEDPGFHTSSPSTVDRQDCDSDDDNSCEEKKADRARGAGRAGRAERVQFGTSSEEASDSDTPNHKLMKNAKTIAPEESQANLFTGHGLRSGTKPEKLNMPSKIYKKSVPREPMQEATTQFMSRYLPDEKNNNDKKKREKSTVRHRYYKAKRNTDTVDENKSLMIVIKERKPKELQIVDIIDTEDVKFHINKQNDTSHALMDRTRREEKKATVEKPHLRNGGNEEQKKHKHTRIQSYFKNWRRQMGTKVLNKYPPMINENKLTVEIFGFVNVQTCKKIVDKAMPAIFGIDPNHVVCYTTEEHYLTDEDSGAPAIRQGHLVAVTVGGTACEGDHVAIGMKMSCFCNWIAENLPDRGANMKCCKDCCDGGDREEIKYYKHYKHKNKYLYK